MRLKRLSNIVKYGLGPEARERKRADKRERREARFHEGEDWAREEDLVRRRYDSYADYVTHQASKLAHIEPRLRENEEADFAAFRDRFAGCQELRGARSVLCLGARLGTEVRALHALGYFAVGLDLNPGADNPFVLPGDFHAVVFPDASVDAIYSNALDHVFDLERVLAEIRRLLRPGGLFLLELEAGFEEGFVPGDYEAIHWRDAQSAIAKVGALSGFALLHIRDFEDNHKSPRKQALFRKTA